MSGHEGAATGPDDRPPRRTPAAAGTFRHPLAWLPIIALAVATAVLAEMVQPWPEGRILVTLHGLGPHGITTSDVIVLALLGMLSVAWLQGVAAHRRASTESVVHRPLSAGRSR